MAFLRCATFSRSVLDPSFYLLGLANDKQRAEQRHVGVLSVIVHRSDLHRHLPVDADESLLHVAKPVLHLLHVPRHLLRLRVGLQLYGLLRDLPVYPNDFPVTALLPHRLGLRHVLLSSRPASRGMAL